MTSKEPAAPLHEGEGEPVGCAEREVGRAVYERIETLIGGNSAELDYLADLVSSVEEYGSYSGPTTAPPPSVGVFGSSAEGADTHRDDDGAVVDEYGRDPKSVEIVSAYRKTINAAPALLSILYDADLLPEQIVSVRAAICMAAVCEAYQAGHQAAVSTAEQVGIRAADEPNPSVEVERLREALETKLLEAKINCDGSEGSVAYAEGVIDTYNIARAALSKQEPGVPTPGGEG